MIIFDAMAICRDIVTWLDTHPLELSHFGYLFILVV